MLHILKLTTLFLIIIFTNIPTKIKATPHNKQKQKASLRKNTKVHNCVQINVCRHNKSDRQRFPVSRNIDLLWSSIYTFCEEDIYELFCIHLYHYESGMQRDELLGLEWNEIDFNNHVIHIHNTSKYIVGMGIIIK